MRRQFYFHRGQSFGPDPGARTEVPVRVDLERFHGSATRACNLVAQDMSVICFLPSCIYCAIVSAFRCNVDLLAKSVDLHKLNRHRMHAREVFWCASGGQEVPVILCRLREAWIELESRSNRKNIENLTFQDSLALRRRKKVGRDWSHRNSGIN